MARRAKASWLDHLPLLPWRVVGEVESADEIPTTLPRRGAVLVVASKRQKWLAFDCPCNLHHRILLNLDQARHPHWRIRVDSRGRLTISPSVSSTEQGRHCHYFIRTGRVAWTKS